jgi:hypothetical protein
MNINLLPFTVLWMILAMVVVGLILYRKWVARAEDDTLHVMDSEIGMVTQQATIAQKLESIDRWGKALTALALVYGLAVGAGYLYENWVAVSNEAFR